MHVHTPPVYMVSMGRMPTHAVSEATQEPAKH
jgi:hypothetical protein